MREKQQFKEDKKVTRNIPFVDRLKYSEIWIDLVKRAADWRSKYDLRKYFQTIDAFIITLLPLERKIIREYQKELDERFTTSKDDRIRKYDLVFEQIVNVLEESSFLTHTSTHVIEGIEGMDEFVKDTRKGPKQRKMVI